MSPAAQYSIKTESPEQTSQFGRRLGGLLGAGSIVLLRGDLGSGKTCVATGIARGLGVSESTPVTSPTYTLMNSYDGRLPLYHFDLYRLSSEEELFDLGFDDYFHGEGVALVEWPERCPELSREALIIDLLYVDDHVRMLTVTVPENGATYQSVIELMCDLVPLS